MEAAVQSIQIYPDGQWPYGGHKKGVHNINKEFVTLSIQIRKNIDLQVTLAILVWTKGKFYNQWRTFGREQLDLIRKKMRDFELEKKSFCESQAV